MRCTACGESWYVPAPEPIEDLAPAARIDEPEEEATKPKRDGARLKVRIEDEIEEKSPRKAGAKARARKAKEADTADFDDEEDDSLFESPILAATNKAKAARAGSEKPSASARSAKADEEETPPKGWRKGKRFFVRNEDAPEKEEDERPFFARSRKREAAPRSDREDALRFAEEDDRFDAYADEDDDAGYDDDFDGEDYASGEARIVDADWEDVDDYGGRSRGFGRRVRAERRRATALARMEDVRRFDPEMFDEQFFASLRVTPRELERAVRKARRRAEAREKNRLTPLRAFGWSAWIAAVAGTIYALVVYRDEIVKMAPSAADAYAVVGIEANPYGLRIEDVRHRLAMSTAGPTIEITGALKNAGIGAVDAPLLQAEALGPRGELLSRWTFSPAASEVEGGGAVEFTTRAPAPDGVSEVALSFAPDKSVARDLLQRGE